MAPIDPTQPTVQPDGSQTDTDAKAKADLQAALDAKGAELDAKEAELTSQTAAREAAEQALADYKAEVENAARAAAEAATSQPTGPVPGDLVSFRFTDPVTGQDLSGAGVVRSSAAGGVSVAPLSPYLLYLAADQVTVVPRPDQQA